MEFQLRIRGSVRYIFGRVWPSDTDVTSDSKLGSTGLRPRVGVVTETSGSLSLFLRRTSIIAFSLGRAKEVLTFQSPLHSPSQQPSSLTSVHCQTGHRSMHKRTGDKNERLGDGGKYERDRDTPCLSVLLRLDWGILNLNTQYKNDKLGKSRPNASTAILRLPDEFLIKIFV
ncbi:hypothetical protein L218DRAFT_629542 [Marasmius fiardii PR-910]|nr:hypothetical protein L218DRAFT_629542 [Marasmius fiardii PR-910]